MEATDKYLERIAYSNEMLLKVVERVEKDRESTTASMCTRLDNVLDGEKVLTHQMEGLQEIVDHLKATNAQLRLLVDEMSPVAPRESSLGVAARENWQRLMREHPEPKVDDVDPESLVAMIQKAIDEHLSVCDGSNCKLQLSSIIALAIHVAGRRFQ